MAELPLEELISAYLDGELSADERVRAEQLLLDDPAARRLFDQFRRLGGHVRQLPRHTLPPDFCQQVLRDAERQMLAQAATPAAASASSSIAGPSIAGRGDARAEQPWSERIRRPLIYAMLAVSVSFVLMAVSPERSPKRGAVAMKERAAGAESAAVEGDLADSRPNASRLAPPAPNISAPSMSAPVGDIAASADAPLPTSTTSPALAPTLGDPLAETLGRSESVVNVNPKGGVAGGMGAAGYAEGLSPGGGLSFETSAQGLLVVECAVAPEALKNQLFQKVLAKQQVQWSYASVEERETLAATDSRASGRIEKQMAGDDASVKLLYVEATPEQMERTLAELSSQPQNFPSVAVDPFANTGRQLRWQNQYSRRSQINNYYNQLGQSGGSAATESEAVRSGDELQGKAAPRASESGKDEPSKGDIAKAQSTSRESPQPPAEPSADAGNAAKPGLSKAGPADNDRTSNFNNLSRARSYSLPRESKAIADAERMPQAAPTNEPDTQAPQQKALSQQAMPQNQLQLEGAKAGSNRLRALFVLQLAEPTEAATLAPATPAAAAVPATPADAAPPEAKPAEPAAKKP